MLPSTWLRSRGSGHSNVCLPLNSCIVTLATFSASTWLSETPRSIHGTADPLTLPLLKHTKALEIEKVAYDLSLATMLAAATSLGSCRISKTSQSITTSVSLAFERPAVLCGKHYSIHSIIQSIIEHIINKSPRAPPDTS